MAADTAHTRFFRRQQQLIGPPYGSPIQFEPVLGAELERSDNAADVRNKVRYMTATMMDGYCCKSLEEIRFEDYCSGRSMPKIHVPNLDHRNYIDTITMIISELGAQFFQLRLLIFVARFKTMMEYGSIPVQREVSIQPDVKMIEIENLRAERRNLLTLLCSLNEKSDMENGWSNQSDFSPSGTLSHSSKSAIFG